MASEGSGDPLLQSVVPILAVDDLEAALAWYRDVLGFAVAWTWGEPPYLAGVCRDRVELQLARRGTVGPPGPSQVYVRMTGIDACYRRLAAAGAEIPVPLEERPYGMKDFSVRDPGGNRLDFGEELPVSDPSRSRA
ncbi:MAG: VOC family protein [Thermodesulfobacteriota bacterium]